MQKLLRVAFLILTVATLAVQPARAVDSVVLTDAQIQLIQSTCQTAQVNLATLHTNDALLRVNLGERYLNIARRLMAPMNSRIALNGLDGVAMTQTAVSYNEGYQLFSSTYATYKVSLEKAMNIDCRTQPIEFYSAIETARKDRSEVAKVVDRMYQLGTQYRSQLMTFSKKLPTVGSES